MNALSKISATSIRFLAASAIALGLVPVVAHAQTAGNPPNVSRPAHMGTSGLPPHMNALNLSQEQKEKLQAIEAAHQEAMTKNFGQMRTNKNEERALVEAPTFDERKAEKLAAQDVKIMEANILATLRFRHEVYQILTPEQRTKFNDMRAQHMKNRRPPAPN